MKRECLYRCCPVLRPKALEALVHGLPQTFNQNFFETVFVVDGSEALGFCSELFCIFDYDLICGICEIIDVNVDIRDDVVRCVHGQQTSDDFAV